MLPRIAQAESRSLGTLPTFLCDPEALIKRTFLFRSKCLHGIDGSGPSGRNHGREQTTASEQTADRQDCDWIVPPDSKEKRLNDACGEPGCDETEGETEGKQQSGFLHHEEHHIGPPRRGPFVCDFSSTATDGMGHEPVETDQCECERYCREQREQRGLENGGGR